MNIKVLSENTTLNSNLNAEHGLSLYIETCKHKILFDTGQSDLFARNAQKLGVDLSQVDIAVISHGHYDHGGGLKHLLAANSKAAVYINEHAFDPHYAGSERYNGLDRGLRYTGRITLTGDREQIDDELTLFTGNGLPRPFPMDSFGLNVKRDDKLVPDDFIHEQYLLIREGGKTTLVSGCSHKGILNIMHWATQYRPCAVIGGFHLMKLDPETADSNLLDEITKELLQYDATYYTCHCTGINAYAYLKSQMGKKLNYLSTGQTIIL